MAIAHDCLPRHGAFYILWTTVPICSNQHCKLSETMEVGHTQKHLEGSTLKKPTLPCSPASVQSDWSMDSAPTVHLVLFMKVTLIKQFLLALSLLSEKKEVGEHLFYTQQKSVSGKVTCLKQSSQNSPVQDFESCSTRSKFPSGGWGGISQIWSICKAWKYILNAISSSFCLSQQKVK